MRLRRGSHLGLTALLTAKRLAPNGTVTCFEATEASAQSIRRMIQLNGLEDKISVVNAVVADRTGAVVPFFEWTMVSGFLGHTTALGKVALALDDYAEESRHAPDFVKIDIEGAERLALLGLGRTLRTHRPSVFVELHSLEGNAGVAANAREIIPFLQGVGYRMLYLKTKQVVVDASDFGNRGRTHVLLLPTEVPAPEWLATFDTSGL